MILFKGETSICFAYKLQRWQQSVLKNHLTNYNFDQLHTFLKQQVLSTLYFEEAASEDQTLNCSEQQTLDHGPREGVGTHLDNSVCDSHTITTAAGSVAATRKLGHLCGLLHFTNTEDSPYSFRTFREHNY